MEGVSRRVWGYLREKRLGTKPLTQDPVFVNRGAVEATVLARFAAFDNKIFLGNPSVTRPIKVPSAIVIEADVGGNDFVLGGRCNFELSNQITKIRW